MSAYSDSLSRDSSDPIPFTLNITTKLSDRLHVLTFPTRPKHRPVDLRKLEGGLTYYRPVAGRLMMHLEVDEAADDVDPDSLGQYIVEPDHKLGGTGPEADSDSDDFMSDADPSSGSTSTSSFIPGSSAGTNCVFPPTSRQRLPFRSTLITHTDRSPTTTCVLMREADQFTLTPVRVSHFARAVPCFERFGKVRNERREFLRGEMEECLRHADSNGSGSVSEGRFRKELRDEEIIATRNTSLVEERGGNGTSSSGRNRNRNRGGGGGRRRGRGRGGGSSGGRTGGSGFISLRLTDEEEVEKRNLYSQVSQREQMEEWIQLKTYLPTDLMSRQECSYLLWSDYILNVGSVAETIPKSTFLEQVFPRIKTQRSKVRVKSEGSSSMMAGHTHQRRRTRQQGGEQQGSHELSEMSLTEMRGLTSLREQLKWCFLHGKALSISRVLGLLQLPTDDLETKKQVLQPMLLYGRLIPKSMTFVARPGEVLADELDDIERLVWDFLCLSFSKSSVLKRLDVIETVGSVISMKDLTRMFGYLANKIGRLGWRLKYDVQDMDDLENESDALRRSQIIEEKGFVGSEVILNAQSEWSDLETSLKPAIDTRFIEMPSVISSSTRQRIVSLAHDRHGAESSVKRKMVLKFLFAELRHYGVLTQEVLTQHFNLWKQHEDGLQRVTSREFNEVVRQTTMPFGDPTRLCLQKVSRSRSFESLRRAMVASVLEGGSEGVPKQDLLQKTLEKLGVTSKDIKGGDFMKIAKEIAVYDPPTQRWNMKMGTPPDPPVELWLSAEERRLQKRM